MDESLVFVFVQLRRRLRLRRSGATERSETFDCQNVHPRYASVQRYESALAAASLGSSL